MINQKHLSILEEIKKSGGKIDSGEPNDSVLLIDGLNTFIRVFTAVPTTNEDGVHIGGIVGFLRSVAFSINMVRPTRTIIVFDGKGGSNRRRKIFPQYKMGRKMSHRLNRTHDFLTREEEKKMMVFQLNRIVQYLECLPLTIINMDNIEADDVIGYCAKHIFKDSKSTIMSTDKDFLQLVDDRVHVWNPTKRMSYNPTRVMEEYNMPSHNFTIFRALDGDKSDNIKGIPGIGLKTLQKRLPLLFEDKKIDLDELIKYAEEHQDEAKVLKNIAFGKDTLYLNYILMQLHEVDISGNTKMNIMRTVREEIPTLVKYKIHKMVVEDKLWSAIPNMDNWLLSFATLNKYANLQRENNG